jgi:hypothetical protein
LQRRVLRDPGVVRLRDAFCAPHPLAAGNILALNSIAMVNGASLAGRALAYNAAVTLDNNNISLASCGPGGGATGAPQPFPPGAAAVPTLPQIVE